jgi:hypothetical protein
VWERTDEQVANLKAILTLPKLFLEEEREKEMDSRYESEDIRQDEVIKHQTNLNAARKTIVLNLHLHQNGQ